MEVGRTMFSDSDSVSDNGSSWLNALETIIVVLDLFLLRLCLLLSLIPYKSGSVLITTVSSYFFDTL